MNSKEMLLNLYRNKPCAEIPLVAYLFFAGREYFLPIGKTERTIRDLGMLYIQPRSPYITEVRNVEIETKTERITINAEDQSKTYPEVTTRVYHTPAGDISEKFRANLAYGTGNWVLEHLIKKPSDYRVLKYILENSTYHENYEAVRQAQDDLGEDGIVYAALDKSPLQKLIVEWAGIERFCFDYYDYRNTVQELLLVAQQKQETTCRIAAGSPAKVIWSPENVTEDIATPELFNKYLVPFYNKQAKLFHKHKKIYAVHLDGKLKHLARLISKTDIDVVESFTLPEGGGNLPLKEALKAWKGKTVAANIPAFLALQNSDYIKQYINGLKEKINYQDNFSLQYSEDLPRSGTGLTKTLLTIACALYRGNG